MLEETGCDGLMVGRGARGNRWIFERINHYLETGEVLPPPGPVEVGEMILRHPDARSLKGRVHRHERDAQDYRLVHRRTSTFFCHSQRLQYLWRRRRSGWSCCGSIECFGNRDVLSRKKNCRIQRENQCVRAVSALDKKKCFQA